MKTKQSRHWKKTMVTAMHPVKLEPTTSEEVCACYNNQLGCILRETANINDENLRKIQHMEHILLTKFHNSSYSLAELKANFRGWTMP